MKESSISTWHSGHIRNNCSFSSHFVMKHLTIPSQKGAGEKTCRKSPEFSIFRGLVHQFFHLRPFTLFCFLFHNIIRMLHSTFFTYAPRLLSLISAYALSHVLIPANAPYLHVTCFLSSFRHKVVLIGRTMPAQLSREIAG